MSENLRTFPAIQINTWADHIQFVESWFKYYPFDVPDYEKYVQLLDGDSYTEEDLLWLFEYLLGEKLTGDRYIKYMEEIGSRIGVWNVLKENENGADLYADTYLDIDARWFVLMHHLLYKFPLFTDNICEAYKFITSDERDEETEEDFFADYGSFMSFSEEVVKQTPGFGEFAWMNALWAFGKFLKEFGYVAW